MIHINADPAVLESVARELDSIAGDISSQRKRLSGVKNQVSAAWKSRYTAEYLGHADTVGNRIQKSADGVREIAAQLRSTAKTIREVEAENQKRFGGAGRRM